MLSLRRQRRLPEDDRGGLPKLLACAGLSAWFTATAASQHPHRAFDRLRHWDPTGLLVPDWRFFGPRPATHDLHVVHRVLASDGEQTRWRETTRITPRVWRHAVWFPDRRRDKAMFDICKELITLMATPSRDVTTTAPFQLLSEFVASEVRREAANGPPPRGFQFLIVSHTGHDQAHRPHPLFASPYMPLVDAPVA